MNNTKNKKLAVLISGRGSNMEAILKATRKPDYPAEIALVVSDNPDAKGLETAAAEGIATIAIVRGDFESKRDHEAAMMKAIDAAGIDLICLAGFMRLLSADFTENYPNRLINIHPSLLPKFKGLDTHKRAIDAGETEHGCTVHFVNDEMDGGKTIAQARIAVLKNDTPDSLAARVLIEEHKLYPEVVHRLCAGC